MKKEYLIEMDEETGKLVEDLFLTYSLKDLKELLTLLNDDVLKE